MDLSRQKKLEERKNLAVTLLCLLGATFGSWRLYRDIDSNNDGNTGKSLAKVELRTAQVRHKSSSSFSWKSTKDSELLYRKEYVQTGEKSSATIRLNDGTLLELGENSLIIIDEVSDLSLNFLHGSAIIRDQSGNDKKLSKDLDGKIKVEKLAVRLVQPKQYSQFYVKSNSKNPVNFEWQSQNKPSAPFVLQISKSPDFKGHLVKQQNMAGLEKVTANIDLPKGDYFWRVLNQDAPQSEVGRFKVSETLEISATSPSADQKINTLLDETSAQFRWTQDGVFEEGSSEGQHFLELSSSSDFKNIQHSQPISPSTGLATIEHLKPGKLFWRVKSVYGETPIYSNVETFSVLQTQDLKVHLIAPTPNSISQLGNLFKFDWDLETSAEVRYQLEVQTPDQHIVLSKQVDGFSFAWKNPPAGNFQWKVTANLGSRVLGKSDWVPFTLLESQPISLKFPKKDEKITFWDKPEPLNFEWESDPAVKRKDGIYVFELSNDQSFHQTVFQQKTDSNHLVDPKSNLQSGLYFWRVKLVHTNGQVLKTSEISNFTYGHPSTLRSPASLKTSLATEVYNPVIDPKDFSLDWAKVEEATGYEVVIYQIVDSKQQIYKTISTHENHISLKDLNEGKYQWAVKSIDRLNRPGDFSEPKNFEVTFGDPAEPPKILSPEVQ